MLKIRQVTKKDLPDIAKINLACFHGCANLKEAKRWTFCNFRAFPRFQYFVAEIKKGVVGYILWYFKGGWRKESVLELEQVAVHPNFQGQGIGTKIVKESVKKMRNYLKKEKRNLKRIMVTTGTKQKAQRIYKKVLGAKPAAKIKGLFRGDEIILMAKK